MLAEVIRLTCLRGLKLLTQVFTKQGTDPDLVLPTWDTEQVMCNNRIVEIPRYIDDSFFVQKARKIGEPFRVGDLVAAIATKGCQKTIVLIRDSDVRYLRRPRVALDERADVDASTGVAPLKPNTGTKAPGRFARGPVLAFFDIALEGIPLDVIDMQGTGLEPVFQMLGRQRRVELVYIESLGEGYLLFIGGASQGIHRVPVRVVRRRQGCRRFVFNVFSGPVGTVTAGECLGEKMGGAVLRVSVENANVIDDKSIVLQNYGGNDSPLFIGSKPVSSNPAPNNNGLYLSRTISFDRTHRYPV